jgi:hypothetical protein
MDIAIPEGNEEELLSMAKRLGITELMLLYPAVSIAQKNKQNGWQSGVITDSPNEIRKAKQQGVFVASRNNEIAVLEASPDFIFGIETLEHKDSLHYRKSGLNQVLCALMERKNVAYGVSFSLLLHASGRQRGAILGRARQNVALCRKFKVKTGIYSFAKDPYDLRSRKDLDAFLENARRRE